MSYEEFWRRYLRANCIERLELSRKLLESHIHACFRTYQEDKELGVHCMASIVNSFFEDLIKVLGERGMGRTPRPACFSDPKT